MDEHTQPSPSSPPRRRSRWRRALLGFALAFLTVYTGAFFQLNDRRLGGMISWLVTRSVRGTFTLGRAHFGYFGGLWSILTNQPTHVTGGDFEMLDPDGHVVMRVPQVEAEAHLQELIGSLVHFAVSRHFHLRLHFSHATLAGGYAIIAPTRSSFGTAKPEMNIVAAMSGKKPPTDDKGELRIMVDDIALGPIEFAIGSSNPQGQLSWIGRLDGATARAKLYYSSSKRRATPDGPAFFFTLRDVAVERGELALGDFLFPLQQLKAAYFGTVPPSETGSYARAPAVGAPTGFGPRQRLAFAATGVTHEGQVRATGALIDAYGAHPGVELRLELEHGAGLATLLPDPIASWIGGDPRGVVTIAGPFSNVAIKGELDGAAVELAGLHVTSAGGRMQLLEGNLLRLDQLHGDVGRGKVRGKVDVRLSQQGTWRAEIDASAVDPAALPPVPPSLRALVGGRFTGRLALGGAFGKPGPRAARGDQIDVEVTGATLARTASDLLPQALTLEGKLAYHPGRVAITRAQVRGEGLTLEASGEVTLGARPSTAMDVSLSAERGRWLGRVGLPSDMEIEHALARGHVRGPFASLDGEARVDVTGLVLRGRHFDRATADVSLAAGKLRVAALTGEGVGASLAGHASLRLFEVGADGRTRLDRRLPEPLLEAQLHAEGANLAEIFGTVGVSGRGDLELSLSGPLTHPTGRASLSVPELALLGDRYRKGRLAFAFSEEGAKVSALELERADGGKLQGSGLVGWKGALDLTLDPRDFPLAAIPGVATLPVAILGTLSGKVHLGGDLTQPQPGGVISLVGAKIRDTVFGDGSLKLEPGADAIHITGKFFENYSVDGYVTLFPKISVAVTVRFNDVELERIFPELRRLADVRGRASGEARITADADGGLTFAGLRLSALSLVLSGLDETGQSRRLVVRNQEDVTLSTNGRQVTIDRCFLRSALGAFSIHGRVSQKDTDVELRGHIGLELLEYFFASLFQRMSGDAIVDLRVRGDLSTRPALLGSLDLRRAHLQPRGLEGHQLFVPSGMVRFEPDAVRLKSLKVELDGAVVQASGRIALDGFVPGAIEGDVSGELSARLIQWARPDQIDDASGRIAATVHLGGTWLRPEWSGEARIKTPTRISLRRSGRELVIAQGTLRLRNYDILIGCEGSGQPDCRALTGMIDEESRFSLQGKVGFGDRLALRQIALRAGIEDLAYNGGDFAVRVSPTLELTGDGRHLGLSGTINVVEGRYTRNFDLVGLLFTPQRSTERVEPFWEGVPLLEQMELDLRAKSTGPLSVRNNIADLSFSADLSVGGTLSDPHLAGDVGVEQGGTINIPLCRFPFVTNRSQLTFDPEKRYPDTPRLAVSATGVLVSDRSDASQNVNVMVTGPIGAAQIQLSTMQGVQNSDVLLMCVTGRTADELRRGTSPGQVGHVPTLGGVQGGSTSEGIAKGATGALVQSALDPLRKIVRLDTFSLEFGATGVDLRACKRWTTAFKTCGQGEIGFIGGTRVGGYAEYKLLDQLLLLGRGEYLTRGIETVQDSLTRGRLELNLRIPLVW